MHDIFWFRDDDPEVKADLKLEDEISHANNVKLSAKISSFDIILEGPAQTKVCAHIFFKDLKVL